MTDRYEKELQKAKDNIDLTLIEFSDMRFAKRIEKTMAELLKTDIMAEYYVPEITEFHVSFEYEQFYPKGGWVKCKLEDLEAVSKLMENCRVKNLDEDDIIELGGKFHYEQKGNPNRLYKLGKHSIAHNYRNGWVIVNVWSEERCDEYVAFAGTIKNKSELRRVLRQTGAIR